MKILIFIKRIKALIAEQNYQIALENLKIAREKNEREKNN